jgi:thiamine pyrophosphate-dependent acetolactate synthase large subunit-like protein
LAVTAGTYVTLGTAAPARVGLSLAKAARKAGRLGGDLAATMGRMLRHMVDWNRLNRAVAGMSLTQPAIAIRAAREAVKVRRARGLLRLADDVGTVQAKAGTRAALDGLRVAETPREMSRIARLAETEGSRTRAILKLAGRGAIALSVATFNLGGWIIGAALALFAFVLSLKSTTERVTMRVLRRRKKRRRQKEHARFAAMTVRG